MNTVEIILALLAIMVALVAVSTHFGMPYPILLVIGGLAIGFAPIFPPVALDPDLVFVLFLPPVIQLAAYQTPIRDFRANVRSISLLAIGLVLVTTAIVGVVAHTFFDNMPWAAAFTLGAIIAPPDAAAATSITKGLSLPRRIIAVVEGESLVNDATALVTYRVAVAAVLTGAFSWFDAGQQFAVASIGGVLVGVLLALVLVPVFRRLTDQAGVYILLTFLTGYGAYALAEAIGGSGILAVVALGVMQSQPRWSTMTPELRLQAGAVWDLVVFLLNGLIFILIGLQLPDIVASVGYESLATLLWDAAIICVTAIVVRIVWTFAGAYLPRLPRRVREHDPLPSWQGTTIVAWMGMRGIVSLATALALPLETAEGTPFPQRSLILFLTFAVIFVTLVFQGLTLNPLIQWLGVTGDDQEAREEHQARMAAAQAGQQKLANLAEHNKVNPESARRLARQYELRIKHLTERKDDADAALEREAEFGQLGRALFEAEFAAVVNLRNQGVINDEVLRRVQRDIDLVMLRMEGAAE